MVDVPIDNPKPRNSWSLSNSTFENYYYKPVDQRVKDATIVNTAFGNVIKKIVIFEATAIVICTAYNQ
ncbi:uncharacterized protein RHIMIDRAFT_77665 [Rhizopus microsporus ATCC 52813]|uniref:Uncharacterized protein n=1 Tax=Rhizopus microsporus ATCC 52813 TaxID=1340429 RepID=A0A2G4SHQ8_RHIZD|nr:uncharacterized protein RHIMIDRAFT_77665 [Rhizopus microsporus ATCC 52813]PHZ08308.1 hypothetical protein RHIMIDRAFT_77665 [Rhizopus microsporus ATCC 52813]